MGKRARKRSPIIKQTANISSGIRDEIQKQGENFETVSTSGSSTACSTTTSNSEKSELSMRASLVSSNSGGNLMCQKSVKILDEQIIDFDNDLVSHYARSDDTRSYASIEEQEGLEKTAEASFRVPTQVVPLKIVQNATDQPMRAEYLSDFDLCNAMDPVKPHLQAFRLDFIKRFEAELKFCEQMIEEVEKIITQNHRTDIELKVIRSRDKRQMPCCKIQLIRSIKPMNMRQELYKNKQLVGFDLVDDSAANVPQLSLPVKRFETLPKIYSAINALSHLSNMFLRR